MIRFKKIYKSLLLNVIVIYSLLLLVYISVVPQELETILTFENSTWQQLSDEVFILSAYLESRHVKNSPFVRVITISKYKKDKLVRSSVKIRDPKTYTQDAFNISCQVLTKDGADISRTEPHETFIFDEKGSQFAATFFNCPIQNISSQPDKVILKQHDKEVTVPVKSIENKSSHRTPLSDKKQLQRTSVCVRALYGPYNNARQLGQFISYYATVLGVGIFNFYLLDATDKVKYVLGELQNRHASHNIQINVMEWKLAPELMSWEAIWDYGALALLTDCVYSNMPSSTYTYIVDMDEFIVPNLKLDNPNSQSMVNLIGQFKRPPVNKSSDGFLFKNSFYCSEYNNNSFSDPFSDDNFDVYRSPFREDFIWSYKLRAKMLVKTSEVVSVGHHMIHNWVRQNNSYNTPVPEQVALLHHYRSCEGLNSGFAELGNPVLNNKKRFDDSISKYENKVKNSTIFKIFNDIINIQSSN